MTRRQEEPEELRNLDRARESGAISDRDYDDEIDAFIAEQNRLSRARAEAEGRV